MAWKLFHYRSQKTSLPPASPPAGEGRILPDNVFQMPVTFMCTFTPMFVGDAIQGMDTNHGPVFDAPIRVSQPGNADGISPLSRAPPRSQEHRSRSVSPRTRLSGRHKFLEPHTSLADYTSPWYSTPQGPAESTDQYDRQAAGKRRPLSRSPIINHNHSSSKPRSDTAPEQNVFPKSRFSDSEVPERGHSRLRSRSLGATEEFNHPLIWETLQEPPHTLIDRDLPPLPQEAHLKCHSPSTSRPTVHRSSLRTAQPQPIPEPSASNLNMPIREERSQASFNGEPCSPTVSKHSSLVSTAILIEIVPEEASHDDSHMITSSSKITPRVMNHDHTFPSGADMFLRNISKNFNTVTNLDIEPSIDASMCRHILSRCGMLETLVVNLSLPSVDEIPNDKILNTSLLRLSVKASIHPGSLLRSIKVPSLKTLKLTATRGDFSREEYIGFYEMMKRSKCMLKTLSLVDVYPREIELTKCLRLEASKDIRKLIVRSNLPPSASTTYQRRCLTSTTVNTLAVVTSSGPMLCPQLNHLELSHCDISADEMIHMVESRQGRGPFHFQYALHQQGLHSEEVARGLAELSAHSQLPFHLTEARVVTGDVD